MIPVILAGGSGTRLWPLSREAYPKQLLPLTSEQSLLQDSLQRCKTLAGCAEPLIISNQQHRFLVAAQCQAIGIAPQSIILEPIGKNTAPAAAIAALFAQAKGEDPLLLVMPADHVIADHTAFTGVIAKAIPIAEQGKLVTFGITPDHAATGYGYIRAGEAINSQAFCVSQFVEKPDRITAEKYLSSGNYFWNSGIFLFRSSVYLRNLKLFSPEILQACEKAFSSAKMDLDFIRLDESSFSACPSDSIDCAVMEKTSDAAVLPFNGNWSDLGSWTSLYENTKLDENQNAIRGDVFTHDVSNSYLQSDNKLLAAVGLDNHIVVATRDAVLVADKAHCQSVKTLVTRLKENQRKEVREHPRIYRPWGYYQILDEGPGFQVKRLSVTPHTRLSLQSHKHRAEHWVVVSGLATVTCDDKIFELKSNESTFIPQHSVHRLANTHDEPLDVIEVQTGGYLGEDDIKRYADDFRRD